MALIAQTFNNFGGLRLDVSPDEVGADQACDLLDVDWGGRDGVLRAREGAFKLTGSPGVEPYSNLAWHGAGFLTRRAATIVFIKNGTEEATKVTAAGHHSFAHMGTPAASYTYIGPPTGKIVRFDGSVFSGPTATVDGAPGKAMPSGEFLAVWPEGGNRLVAASVDPGPGGATGSPSHVWFSNPGDAESYESSAYVQLQPGDGEEIVGCTYWGGQVFVFKETRAYVFYGVDTDEEGKPVFNFRAVDLGTEVERPDRDGNERVVAAAEGVYFTSRDGVWMTTGGPPVQIASDLSPLASPMPLTAPARTTFGELRFEDALGIAHHRGRLYVPLGSEHSASRVLVYDIPTGQWLVWSCALKSLAGRGDSLAFSGSGSAGNRIFGFHHLLAEDESVEMSPRWQSGFYDLETEEEKTLTQARAWGSGSVDIAVAKDFATVGTGKTFTLGTASLAGGSTVKAAQHQRAATGVLHSHKFSGAGPWSIQRFVRYVQAERVPDTQKV